MLEVQQASASRIRELDYRSLASAAETKILPEPEPGTFAIHFIVPAVRSRDVVCAEGPNIGSFEHFLKLLDFIDNALNIHA